MATYTSLCCIRGPTGGHCEIPTNALVFIGDNETTSIPFQGTDFKFDTNVRLRFSNASISEDVCISGKMDEVCWTCTITRKKDQHVLLLNRDMPMYRHIIFPAIAATLPLDELRHRAKVELSFIEFALIDLSNANVVRGERFLLESVARLQELVKTVTKTEKTEKK
jgi:hypothetical protein